MPNSRPTKPDPGRAQLVAFRPGRLDAHEALLIAARVSGCNCDPDIDPPRIYHDPWCRLLRRLEAS